MSEKHNFLSKNSANFCPHIQSFWQADAAMQMFVGQQTFLVFKWQWFSIYPKAKWEGEKEENETGIAKSYKIKSGPNNERNAVVVTLHGAAASNMYSIYNSNENIA